MGISHSLKFYIAICLTLLLPLSSTANFCKNRHDKVKALQTENPFNKSTQQFNNADTRLIVLGEPHQTYIVTQLPQVLDLIAPDIDCAFLEFPEDVPQSDFQELALGKNTNYFRTEASFEYAPLVRKLLKDKVRIIPVDDPIVKTPPTKRSQYTPWMTARDTTMLKNINQNINQCKKAIFLVGKHHITPDISNYTKTLGHKLKEKYQEQVQRVDMIVPRSYMEEYCSYSENNLFKDDALIPTSSLTDVEYSLLVSHSFWSDFDWVLHLRENQ